MSEAMYGTADQRHHPGLRWSLASSRVPRVISISACVARRSSRLAEREEIAILRAQRHGVRGIARRLERAPSTISRELRRNAATRGRGRAPFTAALRRAPLDRLGAGP